MLLKLFKRGVSYVKDLHEMILFGIMSHEELFFIFKATPVFYVMLPMIGLLFTVQAVVKGYELYKTSKKSFDQWFDFISSATSATLTSISLYGTVAATYLGLNFAMGPWLFLASVGVAFTHQITMMSLNAARAYKSIRGSAEGMHYVQASINNGFNLAMITAAIGALIFVMLTPAAPMIGTVCALTAVGLTAVNILWSLLPGNWKRSVKELLGLGKPKLELKLERSSLLELTPKLINLSEKHFQQLFIKQDLSAHLRSKSYLESCSSLFELKKEASLKQDLIKAPPLALQSFWAKKGSVEQIVDVTPSSSNVDWVAIRSPY